MDTPFGNLADEPISQNKNKMASSRVMTARCSNPHVCPTLALPITSSQSRSFCNFNSQAVDMHLAVHFLRHDVA